jgi:hypothetical protein
MTFRKKLEWWETKVWNCEVISQALCPIAKSLMKMDVPKAPTAIHGIAYHPNEKANVIVDCLEIQFTSHDLCDENHKRQVQTGVQAQLASVDDISLRKERPCEFNGTPNECLRHLPRRP